MIKSCIAAMGALTMLSAPAFADYYIVHGPDRHCRVVERVPEGGDFVRVGPLHFGTRKRPKVRSASSAAITATIGARHAAAKCAKNIGKSAADAESVRFAC